MASRKLVQVPAAVTNFNPRADRSWKITFETHELSGDQVALLADSFQGEGWLVFSPNAEVTQADVPEDVAEAGVKTPSQRLRAKIFIMWKSKGGTGDFEGYYRASIEKLIEHIDKQLT